MRAVLAALLVLLALAHPVSARCIDPEGELAVILYNEDYSVFQGCTANGWQAFHEPIPKCPAENWTPQTAAEANWWNSVTYGNGLFVAVATSGTHRVMTSPDGVTWTPRTAAEANLWYSVTYGNGLFVAVAYDGTHRVMTSPDGVNWTPQTAAEANGWRSVTYGNGLFVAVAWDGTHRVMTSCAP